MSLNNLNKVDGLFLPSLLAVFIASIISPTVSADEKNADSTLDVVVVTGTKRTDVTPLKSSAPVDVISSSTIEKSGATRVSDLLQKISPSFNSPTGGFVNNGVKAATLRGLSADQVLVLVNGKRRHTIAGLSANNSQPVDLNTIPVSAIDHIEVLRDGASAQYGSDAIAGVINIVLKSEKEGGNISSQYGVYNSQNSRYGASTSAWKGFELPNDGFLTLAADAFRERHPISGPADPRQWYFAGDSREATARKDKVQWAQPPDRDTWNLLANTEFGLNDAVRLYGTASYTDSRNQALQNFIPPNDKGNVRELFPDGYQPRATYHNNDFSIISGLKYDNEQLGSLDFSVSYGWNKLTQGVSPSLNATFGADSPTAFNDLYARKNSLFNTNLDYVKELPVSWLEKPLNISAGISYRKDRYETHAGSYESWANGGQLIPDGPNAGQVPLIGSRGNTGLHPQDEVDLKRNVKGVYASLEFEPVEKLEIGLTGRYDEYSDAGSTSNGKVSARYALTDSLAFRGSASTGFRAPALAQTGYAVTGLSTRTGTLDFTSTRGLPVGSPEAQALGAKALKPEKSTDYSFGLVFTPIRNASLTVDVYQIEIDDRIVLTDQLGGPLVTNILTNAGFPDIQFAQFFINGVDTRTRGVDVVGKYRFNLQQDSRLDLSAAYSRAKNEIVGIAANPGQLQGSGLQLVGRQSRAIIEDYAPKDKLILSGAYVLGDWDATLSVVRYGEFSVAHPTNPAYDQTYSAQWVTDAEVGYRVTEALRVGLGAKNLFDSYPDKQIPQQQTLGQTWYSAASPAGYDGAFYYANLSYDF
ncbi:TonB-dependent receptor plug domain-containing protein [Aquipseudomonas campi]